MKVNVYMHMCIYMYEYICTCVYMCVYACPCWSSYIIKANHLWVQYVYTCICVYVSVKCVCALVCIYMYIPVLTGLYTSLNAILFRTYSIKLTIY